MSEYKLDFVKDFVKRTKSNNKIIVNLASAGRKNAYEITCLINSLYGLVVLPFENHRAKYNYIKDDAKLAERCEEDYKKASTHYNEILRIIGDLKDQKRICHVYRNENKEYKKYDDDCKVYYFIKCLRNAVAHLNNQGINLLCDVDDKKKEISKILIFNKYKKVSQNNDKPKPARFGVLLEVDELRKLLNEISEMYVKILRSNKPDDKTLQKTQDTINFIEENC